jgi:hypothetical protein
MLNVCVMHYIQLPSITPLLPPAYTCRYHSAAHWGSSKSAAELLGWQHSQRIKQGPDTQMRMIYTNLKSGGLAESCRQDIAAWYFVVATVLGGPKQLYAGAFSAVQLQVSFEDSNSL